MPDDATEGVAEHSSTLQPLINLHVYITAFMFSCSGAASSSSQFIYIWDWNMGNEDWKNA